MVIEQKLSEGGILFFLFEEILSFEKRILWAHVSE
jgi:hypothetical protein